MELKRLSEEEQNFFKELSDLLKKYDCTIVDSGDNESIAFCLHTVGADFNIKSECDHESISKWFNDYFTRDSSWYDHFKSCQQKTT